MGYTTSRSFSSTKIAVHPHSRGVYISNPVILAVTSGSSPLAWGILIFSCKSELAERFIPTRVGYTLSYWLYKLLSVGSSPLAWGILKASPRIDIKITVHPHSRGVYSSRGLAGADTTRFIPTRVGYTIMEDNEQSLFAGSSPLAWGIRIKRVKKSRMETVHPHSRGVYKENPRF